MVKQLILIVAVTAAIIITAAGFNSRNPKQEGMTLESFNQRVGRTDKNVLVYFNADWCVPCIKLKPVIIDLSKDTTANFEIMKLDVDDNPIISTHFEINTLPLFMLYKKGTCVWKHTGLLSKQELVNKLEFYK